MSTKRKNLLEDTDNILSMISVKSYSLEGIDEETLVNHRADFRDLEQKIRDLCSPLYNYQFKKENALLTVQVNGMIVAACVLVLKDDAPNGDDYYHIHTICSTGTNNIREYIILEAEKYARQRNVFFVKITTQTYIHGEEKIESVIQFYKSMGYNIVSETPTGFNVTSSEITTVVLDTIAEINEEHQKILKVKESQSDSDSDYDSDSDTGFNSSPDKYEKFFQSRTMFRKFDSTYPRVTKLIGSVLVLGDSELYLFPEIQTLMEKDYLMKKWDSLLGDGVIQHTKKNPRMNISMWKDLRIGSGTDAPKRFFDGGKPVGKSIVSTLPVNTDVFLGMLDTRLRTYDEFIDDFDDNIQEIKGQMHDACRDTISEKYISGLVDGTTSIADDCPEYIITLSFMGRILAFSMMKIKHTSKVGSPHGGSCLGPVNGTRYLEVKLLCAAESTGMGSHMIKYMEDFAVREDLEFITLESVPTAIDFYRSKGLHVGTILEFDKELQPSAITREGLLHMTKRVKQGNKKPRP